MQNIIKNSRLIVLFGILLSAPQASAIDDAIIAIVNDHVITLKDMEDYLHTMYRQSRTEGKSEEESQALLEKLKENGIEQLIEDRIILDEADRKGLQVREKLIDDRIDEIKDKYESEQAFMDALTEDGATMGQLRKKIEDQMKAKFIVDLEVHSKIFVNPQEVTDYYNAHRGEFKRPSRVNLDSIYIPANGDMAAARQKAQQASQLIKSGKDFNEVTKKFSSSPSIGVVTKGKLVPEIENAVFALSMDEVSAPIETSDGIFIFKLNGKFVEEDLSLETVKNNIYNILFQNKFRERYRTWIDKLKNQAYVEIK